MFNRLIAVTLSLILAAPGFAMAPSAQGPTCAQAATYLEEATRSFKADADRENLDIIDGEFFAHQASSLKTLAETSQGTGFVGAQAFREGLDEFKAGFNRLNGLQEDLNTVYLCLQPGSACNSTTLRERVTEEVRRWLDKYSPEGLNALRERALRASNLMQRYIERVTNISVGTMQRMEECAVPMSGQPRVDPDTGQPVPMTVGSTSPDGTPEIAEPTAKPVDPPKDGGGGQAIIWGLAGAAGLAYGLTGLMPAEDGGTSGGGNRCQQPSTNPQTVCSSQGGSSTACQSSLSAWGTYCRCTGSSGFNAQRGSCQ